MRQFSRKIMVGMSTLVKAKTNKHAPLLLLHIMCIWVTLGKCFISEVILKVQSTIGLFLITLKTMGKNQDLKEGTYQRNKRYSLCYVKPYTKIPSVTLNTL